jgi:hypothetical protein
MIQCIPQATHGLVSPRPESVWAAFGKSYEEFLEILSMPDRYILFRKHYQEIGADDGWRRSFRALSGTGRKEFLELLASLYRDRKRKQTITGLKKFRSLIEHYYPGGNTPSHTF